MDFFGIGAGLKGAAWTYFQAARATGRTLSLVESVKDGDRIVFTNSKEADRVGRLIRERGVKVEFVIVNPKTPERVFEHGLSQGRTIFDHSWVEAFYLDRLQLSQEVLSHIENQASGYGEPHRETRRKALELSKWNHQG